MIIIFMHFSKDVPDFRPDFFVKLNQQYTPKVKTSKKCNACSLKDICLPVLNKKKSVAAYIDKMILEKEEE